MFNTTAVRICDLFGVLKPRRSIRYLGSVASIKRLPDLDLKYMCDPANKDEIETNIKRRDSKADIERVHQLYESFKNPSTGDIEKLRRDLILAALKVPNRSHPSILNLGPEPKVINIIGSKKTFGHKVQTFDEIARKHKLIRMKNLSNLAGPRSYYLLDQLALLEQALIQYSLERLFERGFDLISVPDILNREVIESCGMDTRGERNQVYSLNEELHGKDWCLSGTAEMGIGCYLANKEFHSSQLPLRLASVSRCYRAETSKIAEEKGLYRVHQFTKVEMFGVTTPDASGSLLQEFVQIQEENLGDLGLHLRTLDMPQEELGAQAYRKFDVEAHMPGKGMWGELTSASDCTDYQSRRLNVRLKETGEFLHTINGTACAVPRVIIAIVETHQNADSTINVPKILTPYMGMETIGNSRAPKLTLYKGANDITQ